jgi:hypothetical protein
MNLTLPAPAARPSRAAPTAARVLAFVREKRQLPVRTLYTEFNVRRWARLADTLHRLQRRGLVDTDSTGTHLYPGDKTR